MIIVTLYVIILIFSFSPPISLNSSLYLSLTLYEDNKKQRMEIDYLNKMEKMGKCPFQKNNPIFCPTFQTN